MILYEDGHLKHLRQGLLDFNAIAALGEHISHRLTDSETEMNRFTIICRYKSAARPKQLTGRYYCSRRRIQISFITVL